MPTAPTRLDRDRIVAVAVEIADHEGLDQLSTRSLAGRLGVTPMALYRHVADKDEIVAAVVDVLLARHGVPADTDTDWQDQLRRVATSLRSVLNEQDEALRLFTRRAVTTHEACARLGATVEVLAAAGFDHDAAVHAYASVHTYTIGFSALEAGRRGSRRAGPVEDEAAEDLADTIRSFVTDEQFQHGLAVLIAGLESERSAESTP
jgi:AcrR family transcriptional regulator